MQTERELRAWTLRQDGYTQTEIAQSLGIDQGTVSRILDRVNRRELKRLSARVEALKADQTSQLERIASQAARAWESSTKPLNQAAMETSENARHGKTTVERTSATERDGNVAYLHARMEALAQIRDLWGLTAASGSDGGEAADLAELARSLQERAAAYEQRQAIEQAAAAGDSGAAGGAGGGGADPVQTGPGPVQ